MLANVRGIHKAYRKNDDQVLRHPIHDRRAGVRQILVLLVCAGLTGYFAYHAIYGRHGLVARQRLLERESLLEFEQRSLEAVRSKLKRDISLLSAELPHPDMVEELARDALGFVRPGDRVIHLKH